MQDGKLKYQNASARKYGTGNAGLENTGLGNAGLENGL